MTSRCSLVTLAERPLVGRPFGRPARWIIRMVCGAVYDTNSLEPPVSVKCKNATGCTLGTAPPKKRAALEW